MLKSDKKEYIKSLEAIYAGSSALIVTHYHGLSVAQVTQLRKDLKKAGGAFQVVKNTLSKIAINGIAFPNVASLFKGPTAIAYSKNPVELSKCLMAFAKSNDNLKILGGVVDTTVVDCQSLEVLALLPSLDVLRSKIASLLNAPSVNLVRLLKEPGARVARVARVLDSYASLK